MRSRPDHGRRRFIRAGALLAGGMVLGACSRSTDSNRAPATPRRDTEEPDTPVESMPEPEPGMGLALGALMCGGNQINAHTGEERFVFTQLSLDETIENQGAKPRLITDIGFLAHGVIKHPLRQSKVLVFEKKGRGGAEIDLKGNRIVERIAPGKGNAFYGHGAYSADAKLVYATEYDEQTYQGKMTVRDAEDYTVIGEFPTHGEWPHDCQFIDDGKVVAVTNGGGHMKDGARPNVAYVEVESGRLLEKIEFENKFINAGHLAISESGDLVVAHAMREGLPTKEALGGISLRPTGGEFRTMIEPAEVTALMRGETLSLCIHEDRKLVAATNPYGEGDGFVTFWNYEKQEFAGRFPAPGAKLVQPRGVGLTLDRRYWVITYGRERAGVILVNVETLKPDTPPISFEAETQGSHAYIHDWYEA